MDISDNGTVVQIKRLLVNEKSGYGKHLREVVDLHSSRDKVRGHAAQERAPNADGP